MAEGEGWSAALGEETTVALAWEVEEVDRPGNSALEGGGELPNLMREFEFEFGFEARNVGKRFLMAIQVSQAKQSRPFLSLCC
jgi:hypothetical protein